MSKKAAVFSEQKMLQELGLLKGTANYSMGDASMALDEGDSVEAEILMKVEIIRS